MERRGHAHHLVGDAVGFLLVLVSGLVDCELGLDGASLQHSQGRLIADAALQAQKRMFPVGLAER
jgi:hypothetical protein